METILEVKKALEFVKNNKFEDAEKIYLNLLKETPNNSNILSFLGLLYIKEKDFFKAEKIFEKAYSFDKNEIIISNLAFIKKHFNRLEEALNLYAEVLKISQKSEYYIAIVEILLNLTIYTDRKKYINDLYYFAQKSLKQHPLNKHIILNYSISAMYIGNFNDSEKYCNLALKIDSKFAQAWNQLGFLYECLYLDMEKSQEYYKLALKYGAKTAYYNLAVNYLKNIDYKNATNYFHKSLKFNNSPNPIYLGLAKCFWAQKKFNLGYKYYTKQLPTKGKIKLKNLWNGNIHKDKTLFILSDLCFGDHIMFIRYLPFVAKNFKMVFCAVFPQVYDLFKKAYKKYPNIKFIKIENNKKYPKYDYSVFLSTLPYYLKMDFKHIPFSNGYLNLEKQIKNNEIKNIGICWQAGNIDIRSSIYRTININEFKKIFDLKNYNFYSFQVEPSNNDYKKYTNLIDLGKDFKNFDDTANALKKMDLVISVDTSVANLAGAMGIKTFLLIPYYSNWRWFNNTKTTEWYDSIMIFKQTEKSSWNNEFKQIKEILIDRN